MADIRNDQIRTYVLELIAKEFESNDNGEKALSDNFKTITCGYRVRQRLTFYEKPSKQE